MIADVVTIMRKEWQEYAALRGSPRGGVIGLLLFAGFLGVVMPLQIGRAWADSPVAIVSAFWMPLILVLSVIADSFAGERERHTLETLLSTRLSDRAILFGKVVAAIGYGWGLTLIAMALGLVALNLVHRDGGLVFFAPGIALGIVLLSLLGAGLTTGAGVLVSLRARTVREAQQHLSIAMMVIFFGLLVALQALPEEWLRAVLEFVTTAGPGGVTLAAAAILLVVDAALLLASMRRFRRSRLLLDE